MVKRSRHRPFTAVTRVRFPVGSPLEHLILVRCFIFERHMDGWSICENRGREKKIKKFRKRC